MSVPSRGDVVWISLDPSKGHEQKGDRPVLVLSPIELNDKLGLIQVCPITHGQAVNLGVPIPSGCDVDGVVMPSQITTLDWRARDARLACHLPDAFVDEVAARVVSIIQPD